MSRILGAFSKKDLQEKMGAHMENLRELAFIFAENWQTSWAWGFLRIHARKAGCASTLYFQLVALQKCKKTVSKGNGRCAQIGIH